MIARPQPDILAVRVRPGETRIARIQENGKLRDFALYRDEQPGMVGDVFWARVRKVMPNLEAAFIDIGAARDGFLGIAEARPQAFSGGARPQDRISDYVHEGQALLVQVVAAARDDKGAKLTRRVNVSGAYAVLTPNDPGIRISKRISDDHQRNRLRTMVSGLLGDHDGCVIRSAAEDATERTVKEDLAVLQAEWLDWQDRAKHAAPPHLISNEALPTVRYLSDHGHDGIGRIVIDHGEMAQTLKRELDKLGALPVGGVEVHARDDVFTALGVAEEIDGLIRPRAALPGGGSIVIEEGETLTAIDINAAQGQAKGGNADPALATNLEAMKEIARQMRLRNLGGLIVIDLIGMRGADGAGRVVTALKDAVVHDPAGPQVLGTTRGGLLEVTRPRRRPPLSHELLANCPICGGRHVEAPLSVGYRALDQVMAEVWAQPALIPCLSAPPLVVDALLRDGQAALTDIETKLGQALELRVDDSLGPEQFRVDPI